MASAEHKAAAVAVAGGHEAWSSLGARADASVQCSVQHRAAPLPSHLPPAYTLNTVQPTAQQVQSHVLLRSCVLPPILCELACTNCSQCGQQAAVQQVQGGVGWWGGATDPKRDATGAANHGTETRPWVPYCHGLLSTGKGCC